MNSNEPDNANNNADNQSNEKPKTGKGMIIGIIIAILAIVGVSAAVIVNNNSGNSTAIEDEEPATPKEYMEKAWRKTWKLYASEFDTLVDNNTVFSKFSELSGKPSTHTLTIGSEYTADLAYQLGMYGMPGFDLDLILQNDPQSKQFKLGTVIPTLGELAIHLSDDELIVSAMGKSFTIQAKTFLAEIKEFAVLNEIDPSAIEEAFPIDELDLSYSNLLLMANRLNNPASEELTPIADRYKALWNELYDKAEAELDEAATVKLEDQSEDCSVVRLTFRQEDVKSWLTKVYETVSADQELRAYCAEQYEIYQAYSYSYDSFDEQYDEFLIELQTAIESYEGGDYILKFYIYEGTVVRTNLITKNPSAEVSSVELSLSVTGKEYRLNEILFTGVTEYPEGIADEVSFSIKGNHIGDGVMTSEWVEDGETVFSLTWDPEETMDNLHLESEYESYNMTLTVEDDSVVFKPIESSDDLIYRAEAVESGLIEWPAESKPLRETTLEDLYSLFY